MLGESTSARADLDDGSGGCFDVFQDRFLDRFIVEKILAVFVTAVMIGMHNIAPQSRKRSRVGR
ncbi:hypothetical protein HMPREF3092_03085 [Brevibacterium sp. HMSC24B04]|nr:hypothetical protein HMPREF3092_03085 [Brevibacterium sp. HMSC24B04]